MAELELHNMATQKDKGGGMDNPAFFTDGTQSRMITSKDDTYVNLPQDTKHHSQNGPQPESNEDVANSSEQVVGNDADDDSDLNACARGVNRVQKAIIHFFQAHQKIIVRGFLIHLFLAYLAYVAYCMYWRFGDEGSIRLLVCTLIGIAFLVLHFVWDPLREGLSSIKPDMTQRPYQVFQKVFPWVLYAVSLVTMVTLLIVLVALDSPSNLISLSGLVAFIFLSWITSINPARVNWHPVFWGFSLQFFFAAMILKTQWGHDTFQWLGDRVTEFLTYANEGAAFVFGDGFREHFFAFALMPVIVFFSSVISVLYYLGVMQAIVSVLGRFLALCLRTTPAESINAAGNIFVGMTEAPLMIRPFIGKMTRSELHAVMTGGFATIAGTVLGAYIGYGVPANHLLSASVMSAPAALAISKLTYPETEVTVVSKEDYRRMEKGSEENLIEAASAGASNAILLVANVVVNVIAFLSILKFLDNTLIWFGDRAGVEGLTFQFVCSYVLYPVALFMGIKVGPDCRRIGELVGVKTFTNEFIAYRDLSVLLNNRKTYTNYSTFFDVTDPHNVVYNDLDVNLTQWNRVLKKGFLTPRSEVIATYALCGFSNFGSMGVMLGALSAMAPHRRQDLSAIVVRAMISGNIACFFTACIAGLFYEEFD